MRRLLVVRAAGAAAAALTFVFPLGAVQLADSSVVPVVLTTPASVRSAGIRGTGAALVGYAGAVFSNPAGIATIRHVGLEAGYRSIPGGGGLATGALAWRIGQFDLGFGGAYLDFGRDASTFLGPGSGTDAREIEAIGSLVYRFGIIAMGGSAKYIRRTVDDTPERAVSTDAGIAIAIFDIMAIGFSVQNLGGNWSRQSALRIPRLSRWGFTMNYVDPLDTFRLLSTIEVQWPEGQGSRLILGAEAGVVSKHLGVVVRAGYGSRPDESAFSEFTYGATVSFSRGFQVDYAYQGVDLLNEAAHRFGFRLAL